MNLFKDAFVKQQINEGSDCLILTPKINLIQANSKKTFNLPCEDVDESSQDSHKRVTNDSKVSGEGLIAQNSDLISRVTDAISEYSGVFVGKNPNFNDLVLKEHRAQFRMIFRSSLSDEEEHRRLANSDLVYFDHYFFELQEHSYSQEAQEAFYLKKNQSLSRLQLSSNQCHLCGDKTKDKESFFQRFLPWESSAKHDTETDCLKYCHFCMDT